LKDENFKNPRRYSTLKVADYDGLMLPGGHAKGIKPYLEDKILQRFVTNFFENKNVKNTHPQRQHKTIAAICHGVLIAARAISTNTNKSVLYGKKTTALTWALESSAWQLTKYFARFWDKNYYRTYLENSKEPTGFWSVEQEVKRALQCPEDFLDVPKNTTNYLLKTSGIFRDSLKNNKSAWVVQDGNYLSARWPGDVHTLTQKFIKQLKINNTANPLEKEKNQTK